jgi:hypothetical protein
MEDLGKMEGRVREAAEWLGKDNGDSESESLQRMGVSPQCGFASHSSGNAVKKDDMTNKLKLVRQLADKIWPGDP